MRKSAFETVQRFQFGLSKIREYWEYFRTNTRLFCVSEVNDDILMWAHYAENHEGAVVKLRCLCDQDRPLCAAIQVNYRDEYPLISKLEKYVKHLTGQDKLNYDNLFREFLSTKSTHWRYEREWRCVGWKNEGSEGLFHYETIIPEELEAIYLGCRINSTDEQELIHILDDNFPDTEIYRAKTVEQKFKIQFEKIR